MPKLRFKGLTDDWEQRKLIDGCEYVDYRGKTPNKTENGVFLVTAKNVKAGYIDYEASQEYIAEEDYDEVMHRGMPQIGDVLITTEAPCGNVAQVDREDIALAQRIIKYRGHENQIDNTYLKHYLLTPYFQGVLESKSSGGTVQGIKGSILHQQIIRHPSFEEQVKIGRHLDSIDNLIVLHQRKCDELQTVKKYMLQKMFPKKGEKVPEIRFAGFTGDWEQRKFPEFVQFYNGQTYKPEDVQDDGVLVLRSSNVKNDEIVDADNVYLDKSVANAEQVRKGDIIVVVRNGSRALIGKHAEIKREMSNTVIGAFMTGIRSEHSSFVNALLGTPQFEREIEMNMGATINQITGYMFSKMAFMIPSGDEQDKIGAYFKGLDDLITLYQRKHNTLKEVKKYMLQNMFPKK